MRIAMWSGPRNLSTAMMYAFAQRSDCTVMDEPFYAAFLALTGDTHPMREEILAAGPTDLAEVIAQCRAGGTAEAPHVYQKHMTQHMLPAIDRGWMAETANVFLIRHPARVIASYVAKRESPTLDEIGFRQQFELFDHAKALGQTPIVVDSADIRTDPPQMLSALCEVLGLPFETGMLHWPMGGHPSDGVWAPHWYGAVHNSTGFAAAEGPLPELGPKEQALCDAAMPYYLALRERRLTI